MTNYYTRTLLLPILVIIYAVSQYLNVQPGGFQDIVGILMGIVGVASVILGLMLSWSLRNTSWAQKWYSAPIHGAAGVVVAFILLVLFARVAK